MIAVVSFVSLMVHIYTIGYMADDPGYTRFFSYISLFTFSMLMLVMANNFLQLFFGWEAVGLVSYLLIGFWYDAADRDLRQPQAFLANRVGDFGFVLGIGLIVAYFGSLDYADGVRGGARARAATTLNLVGDCAMVGADRDLHRAVRRGDGQVGAGAAARLASRLDGGPDPDLGADPRRDDGDRRHLHGRAHEPAVRALRDRAVLRHRSSARRPRCSWRCSASCRTTSSASSPTRRCRSSAT